LYLIHLERAPITAFFLLPPRMWELMVGALVAVWPWRWPLTSPPRTLAAGIGLTAILIAVACAKTTAAFQGYLVIPVCLGAAALVQGASRPADGLIGQMLSLRPARFLGRISYSVYLWQTPILTLYAYGAMRKPDRSVELGLFLLTITVALASYRWIEMPIRRRQSLAAPTRFGTVLGLSLAGVLLAMAGVIAGGGLPARWPKEARGYALSEKAHPDATACLIPSGAGNCRPGQPLDLLVWGDSHAEGIRHLSARLTEASGAAIGFAGHGGCPPLPGLRIASKPVCAPAADAVIDWIGRHPVRAVLIAVRWDAHTGEVMTFDTRDGTTVHGLAAVSLGLRALVDRLNAAGTRIIAEEPTPVFPFPVSRKLTYLAAAGRSASEAALSGADYERQLAIFHAIIGDLAETGRIEIMPTHDLYCDATRCPGVSDAGALFWDASHMTAAGFALLAPRLVDLLRALRPAPSADK